MKTITKNCRIVISILLCAAALIAFTCCRTDDSTPTAAAISFCRALDRNDLAAIKVRASKDSLVLGERLAKAQNQSLDEFISDNAGRRITRANHCRRCVTKRSTANPPASK